MFKSITKSYWHNLGDLYCHVMLLAEYLASGKSLIIDHYNWQAHTE